LGGLGLFFAKAGADGAAGKETQVRSQQRQILVVDDEPQICDLIRDQLLTQGLPCVTMTEGLEARRALEIQSISVLITDAAMPGCSGLDLLVHARHRLPDCKVILITGLDDTRILADALALGAYDYFHKPFQINALVEAVIRALEDAEQGRALSFKAARALQKEWKPSQPPLESVRALARAVEAKDPHTHKHSEHVAHYAVGLAECLGRPNEEVESLRVAALLHDIGKIGIPDHILTKAGRLTEAEFEHIRGHPGLGAEILQSITSLAAEARVVRYHHENWNGSGYPEGLKEGEIPLGSRIINVADSMDAMLMERTYKVSYSVEEMLAELAKCAGSQFDPAVAAAAIQWCHDCPRELFVLSHAAVP